MTKSQLKPAQSKKSAPKTTPKKPLGAHPPKVRKPPTRADRQKAIGDIRPPSHRRPFIRSRTGCLGCLLPTLLFGATCGLLLIRR